jgi:hypothetical protein
VYKYIGKITIVLAIFTFVFVTVSANTNEIGETATDFDNYEFIEEAKLSSSRYTGKDDMRDIDPETIIEINEDDELVTENSRFEMYYNDEFVSFKVRNKFTGYVWSTNIENPVAGTYNGLLESGIAIEYIDITKDMQINENIGITETIFIAEAIDIPNGIKLDLNFGGYCATRVCERLYPRYLDGDYTKEEMEEFGLTEINIGFDMEVTLSNDGLEVNIPYESIEEGNSENVVLSSVIVFPALGATKMDETPGYMVIPDGAGALIRYEDNEGKFFAPFEERFYQENFGLNSIRASVTNYPLSMPIFGAVHGVEQNAFVGIIEKGDSNARLLAFPNGTYNLDYNLIFTKIDYRQTYRQSFSSDGTGGAMRYLPMYEGDVQMKYNFLDSEYANYVGIGRSYQGYLLDNDLLQNIDEAKEDIGIFLDFLMAESENSFFGTQSIEMSTVEEVMAMYEAFMQAGLTNQVVGLLGWNDGGLSGHLPSAVDFENKLGSNNDFQDLIDLINEENKVILYNNYVFGSEATDRIRYRRDVAEGSNRFKLELNCYDCVYQDFYVLYPETTKSLALEDYNDYLDQDVEVMFPGLGNILFSYYDDENYNRQDTYDSYKEVMEVYKEIGNYSYPMAYAYMYLTAFYDTPLYNSQLKYYDDLVPLLQTVLKGYVPMYSPYLNFNSLGQEQILTLIDFGVYPSYVLTHEASSFLKDTDAAELFTTEYRLWKDTVISEYEYINGALSQVIDAKIIGRKVVDTGIVRVSYSNGLDIIINYTSQDYDRGFTEVDAMTYNVVRRDQ